MITSDGITLILLIKLIINFIQIKIEPGYYQDGEFGIRLETDLEVVNASTEVTN